MDWREIGSLFCLQAAFGIFTFLAVLSRAPVGPYFFRIHGAAGAVALITAWWLHFGMRLTEGGKFEPTHGAILTVLAIYLLQFRRLKVFHRKVLLWTAAGICLVLLGLTVPEILQAASRKWSAALTLSATLSGLLLGGTGISMVFGHHYLTVPGMDVGHLARLNGGTALALLGKVGMVAGLMTFHQEGDTLQLMNLFHLGTRVLVGLAFPLLLAWMIFDCLRYRNTQSATGILYVSTFLVILGEGLGLLMLESYGIPL